MNSPCYHYDGDCPNNWREHVDADDNQRVPPLQSFNAKERHDHSFVSSSIFSNKPSNEISSPSASPEIRAYAFFSSRSRLALNSLSSRPARIAQTIASNKFCRFFFDWDRKLESRSFDPLKSARIPFFDESWRTAKLARYCDSTSVYICTLAGTPALA